MKVGSGGRRCMEDFDLCWH